MFVRSGDFFVQSGFLGHPKRATAVLKWAGLLLLGICGGCGPELSKNDLGTVVFEVPRVADPSKPYPMPQLGPPLKHNEEEDAHP